MLSQTIHRSRSALKAMLDLHGLESNGAAVLQAMESPFLFLQRDGAYWAGSAFLSPAQLDLYLLPRGLRLNRRHVTRRDLLAFLKTQIPAMLCLPDQQALIVLQCDNQRVLLKAAPGAANPVLWINAAVLIRKLPQTVSVITLDPIEQAAIDMIPLLGESMRTLAAYRQELAVHMNKVVTRQSFQALHQHFFRALLLDLPHIAPLYQDSQLQDLLMSISHVYRHLFIAGEDQILLRDHLPLNAMLRCTLWLQEIIIDRLHELCAPEELIDSLYPLMRL